MNTPNLGPVIEVTSQPSDVGGQIETRVSRETKTAIHPFGSALLRLELVRALISVRRTRAVPPKLERGQPNVRTVFLGSSSIETANTNGGRGTTKPN